MLEALFGSINRERVLLFLCCRNEGYATEISEFFEVRVVVIQNQLERLESGGVIFSRKVGRTRNYALNPRYVFRKELIVLLKKALSFYPQEMRDKLELARRRPRRKGKPL
jgi:predicted transcriptional regulator